MAYKLVPSTQSQIDEVALDAAKLAEEMGLPLDNELTEKVAGRKSVLLTHAALLSLSTLLSSPIIFSHRGWKFP